MKTRTGFVSNSSSSSFLIAKKSSDINIVIPSETRPLPASPITSIKELIRIFEDEYWGDDWTGDEDLVAIYVDATKRMAEGETLFYTVTDNWDDLNFWREEEVMELNDIEIILRGSM